MMAITAIQHAPLISTRLLYMVPVIWLVVFDDGRDR